ncbi:MAG: hypothetical protein Q8O76_05825 [Chloroflexota bacterium]|nr:hypothetical protein [Chloroflexota bacterium]
MTQESQVLSQVVPVLVAVLACDVAVADPSTGKKNLIGIFDRVNVGRFPTQRPISLYIKVTDAEGYYKIEVRYVQVRSGQILAKAEGELHASDRLVSSDMHIPFPPLPIPEEGRYEFQVWFNSMFLGGTSITAVPRAQP